MSLEIIARITNYYPENDSDEMEYINKGYTESLTNKIKTMNPEVLNDNGLLILIANKSTRTVEILMFGMEDYARDFVRANQAELSNVSIFP